MKQETIKRLESKLRRTDDEKMKEQLRLKIAALKGDKNIMK